LLRRGEGRRIEDRMIDGELAASAETARESRAAGRAVEDVVPFDPDHSQPPPFGGHRVALAAEFLFPGEQAQAGLQPVADGIRSGEVPRLQGVPGNPWSSPASLSI